MKLKKIMSFFMILVLFMMILGVSTHAVTDTGVAQKRRGVVYSKRYTGSSGNMTANGNNAGKAITIMKTKGKYYSSGYVGRYTYKSDGSRTYATLNSFTGVLNMTSKNVTASRSINSYTHDYVHGAGFWSGATSNTKQVDSFLYTARQYYD